MSLFKQPMPRVVVDPQMYADAVVYVRGLRAGDLEDIAVHLRINKEKARLVAEELKENSVIVLQSDGQWRVRRPATITRLPTARASPSPGPPQAMGAVLHAGTSASVGIPTQVAKGGGEMSDVRITDLIDRADGNNQQPSVRPTERKSKPSRPRDGKNPAKCPRCKNERILDSHGLCSPCRVMYYNKGGARQNWTLEEFIRQCPPRAQKKVKLPVPSGGNAKGVRKASTCPAAATSKRKGAPDDFGNLQELLRLLGRSGHWAKALARAITKLRKGDDGDRQQVKGLKAQNKALLLKNHELQKRWARIVKTVNP